MDRSKFLRLLLWHQANHGPVLVKEAGHNYIFNYQQYKIHEDEMLPYVEIRSDKMCGGVSQFFYHEFNKSWYLLDSRESKHLKTLAKEGKTMEKTNVIIGLVAVPEKATQILKVIADPKAKVVVVKFTDGATEVVHCSKEDEFDVYVGVAIAEARHKYGTTSKFHKAVDTVLTVVKPKVKKAKPVPMGPIAPGQEPVRRPRKPRTTNKKGSK